MARRPGPRKHVLHEGIVHYAFLYMPGTVEFVCRYAAYFVPGEAQITVRDVDCMACIVGDGQ
jgi:hypothetical protein